MATKELSDKFIQKIMTEEAWKELSIDFNWSEPLLELYQDKVDWNEVSKNRNIRWTVPMMLKFQDFINWDNFSEYIDEEILTENNIMTFLDKWNWHKLSGNTDLHLSHDLLNAFSNYWDWEEIIDRYYNNLFDNHGIDFYECYKDLIPVAKLQGSRLWREIVSQQKRQLIEMITA